MKQILLIIISGLLGQISFAQSDSVYLLIDSKLISEIQIISPQNENGTREKYTYFKNRYWLGETDTVSMTIIDTTDIAQSKKKRVEYHKYGACDSIINKIRNSSYYWKMRSDIDKVARQEIGYGNIEFNNLLNSESNRPKDFSEKCQDEFKIDLSILKDQLLNKIQRIKEGKVDRFNRLRSNPESIDSKSIYSFLETFDLCETDLKSLELIILQNPTDFLTVIDKLNDYDFFSFTLKLDDFPEDANISEMKENLKKVEIKSRRKKKTMKKIKKTKD